MGGFGSGNRLRFGTRGVVETHRSLDIRRWQREGFLRSGHRFGWQWTQNGEAAASIGVKIAEASRINLEYRVRADGDKWEEVAYSIHLCTTPCHYGGCRVWFNCPALGCGRRVAKLYLGSRYFVCRHCLNLAYQSQHEDPMQRGISKAQKMRARLGDDGSFGQLPPPKPTGMHWRTYERLCQQVDDAERQADQAMMLMLGRVAPELFKA